jgi:hypothetical protein
VKEEVNFKISPGEDGIGIAGSKNFAFKPEPPIEGQCLRQRPTGKDWNSEIV